jgi:hypothetical protein
VGFRADLFEVKAAAFAMGPHEGIVLNFSFFLGSPDPSSALRHLFFLSSL